MTPTRLSAAALSLAAALLSSGCEGPRGPAGKNAADGSGGGGTLAGEAPLILSLSPARGSAGSRITIEGENFSSVAAENQVFFDGTRAEILEAAEGRLVVRPVGAVVREARAMQVTVITGELASNGFAFLAHPSGAVLRAEAAALGWPVGIAAAPEADVLYVTDMVTGFHRLDPSTSSLTPVNDLDPLMPAPLELDFASDGRMVYFTAFAFEDSFDSMVLVRLDLETGAWIASRPMGSLQGIHVTDERILVGDKSSEELLVLDPTSLLETEHVALPGSGFGGFGNVAGIAAIGDKVYVAGGANVLYEIDLAAGTPAATALALPALSRVRGVAANGDRIHLLTDGGELLIDPVAPAIVDTAGTFAEGGTTWRRASSGEWIGASPMMTSVRYWSVDGGGGPLHPLFLPFNVVIDGDDVLWSPSFCHSNPFEARGVWRTGPAGTELIDGTLCASDLVAVEGGGIVAAGTDLETMPASYRVVALDPDSGAAEVLLQDLPPVAGLARDGNQLYVSAATEISRVNLDGTAEGGVWGTASAPILDLEIAGDELVIRTITGLERIPLSDGGASTSLVPFPATGTFFGGLSVDRDGSILLADGLALHVLDGDVLRPLAGVPIESAYMQYPVLTAERLDDGELLLAGHGALHRVLP